MKQIGKIGKQNLKANYRIKKWMMQDGIRFCEARLEGCTPDYALTIAHRHKRIWYRDQMHLLSDPKQVILACINCHEKMEVNKELTEVIFKRLRGDE